MSIAILMHAKNNKQNVNYYNYKIHKFLRKTGKYFFYEQKKEISLVGCNKFERLQQIA